MILIVRMVVTQSFRWRLTNQIPFRAQDAHRPLVPITALVIDHVAQPTLIPKAHALVGANAALVEIVYAQVDLFEPDNLERIRQKNLYCFRAVAQTTQI